MGQLNAEMSQLEAQMGQLGAQLVYLGAQMRYLGAQPVAKRHMVSGILTPLYSVFEW